MEGKIMLMKNIDGNLTIAIYQERCRLNGKYMLELLRGKRMVFVGDSLNRNMWESMLCILQNEAPNKNNVFEVSGRQEFRTEGSYSFMFQDYNFTVEFFRTTFLVQEWESEINGTKKETLRIDRMESAAEKYKDADVLVFNTGHWWTHEKTSSGKGYYQEGEHVYDELNVDIAFRKSMSTWANWVEANVDPLKTLVLFRGYSVSHFRGGEWNSGGHCDGETEPLKEEKEFETDPPMVKIMESVLEKMKAPVFYLNVTRMTNFRKDAHPSFFREINSSEEDKKSGVRIQDCSHWCLPGVPDMWNQIIYAQLLFKHREKLLQQHLLAQRSP
ncbi:protein trichome birefringence-like 1 isoform X2 [Mercurialis annua]|uniref:protein trichome birefringence-like 1 isoform X2 n=1 Tax=Mercurialis annua TaxID=3986 RepID=UPI00215E4B76|nr:protein trichome birefringence-like 1 isoform X2 [Mercurialis annua]